MNGEQRLWAEVLFLALQDATLGVRESGIRQIERIHLVERARAFFRSRDDFTRVCNLAGIDPTAARERILPMIAKAPPPEEIVSGRAKLADGSRVPTRRAPSVHRKSQKGGGGMLRLEGVSGDRRGDARTRDPENSVLPVTQ